MWPTASPPAYTSSSLAKAWRRWRRSSPLTARIGSRWSNIEALAQFTADGWLAALAPILQAAKPILTLAPDSGYGRAWLPRLSARWRIPMATGCIRVKVTDEGYPEVFRVSHNGKLHERQIWARGTAVMVMLWPGVRGVGPSRADRRAEVERVVPDARSVLVPRPHAAHPAARSARRGPDRSRADRLRRAWRRRAGRDGAAPANWPTS